VSADGDAPPGATLEERTLHIRIPPGLSGEQEREAARSVVKRWLIDRAIEVASERMPALAKELGVTWGTTRIKDLRSRWGSCSTTGNISINYRVVMAPPEVMDYLFVHELAHLVHHNHSAEYWAVVAKVIPEHKRRRAWLRDNRLKLEL